MTELLVEVVTWPDEATRTPNSPCLWIAETTIDGRTYAARSRHGAANELKRQLVNNGLTDRPMIVRRQGRPGEMTYRSFHAAAKSTCSEGASTPLRRVPYREQPEGMFPPPAEPRKCVTRAPADVAALRTAEALEPLVCGGCGKAFQPRRSWSLFCGAACRQKAHRVRSQESQSTDLLSQPAVA